MSMRELAVLIVAIVFNAAANIMLKSGMKNSGSIAENGVGGMVIKALCSVYVWGGLMAFGIAFVFYSVVLSKMDLSKAYPIMTSAGFAIVVVASALMFQEHITWPKLAGIAVIAVGIWIVSAF